MGRSSSASSKAKSNAKASKKVSSKGSKDKVYCSKVIATILDKLIEEELSKVKKHPKTVGKWMAKMRSSILKKVSISTPFLFKSENHDMNALDRQLATNLKKIDATKAKILESSKAMWQANFVKMQQQSKQGVDSRVKTRHGSNKKNTDNNVFSDRVNVLNQNIDQMANQLSSIGKDIENRVTSLNSSIQAAEKLWTANPMCGQRVSSSSVQRPVPIPEQQGDVSTEGANTKSRVYRDLDAHLSEY